MKFLVLTKPRSMPPERGAEVLKAQKEWFRAKQANHSLDIVYGFPEGGGVSIGNADSPEALMRLIREAPAFPFVEFEIRPLVDINTSLDSAVQMFERMAAPAGRATITG
jgi:muconolactone delta-isomerase